MTEKSKKSTVKPIKAKKTVAKDMKSQTPIGAKPQNLPPEVAEKLKVLKTKLDKFKDEVIKKFDKYIMGISLLPPPKTPDVKNKDKVSLLVLVDDSDSQKMGKLELKNKLSTIISTLAKNADKNFFVDTVILSELWQSCYDAKYDILQTVAMGAPVYDTGMLSAIKIAELHKSMVLKKFEKYIVSYVLAGSLVQGKATPSSDIDVFVVIDDTDVKRMTRAELKDKLRAIIIGMGIEAGEITGIRNKINIQVYILTDFWDSIREANPIIFTFLRDGIPLYDRGIFMPWKQLLKMGRIKPSTEAIDIYMSSGEQMFKRVQAKFNEMGMEDVFYAVLTPSQAAIMLYGLAPPTPKETPSVMREIFVKKEKLFEESYVKILEKVINLRKDLEHGTKKNVSGMEIDGLLKDAHSYLKRLKKLFSQIEQKREEESILHIYETVVSLIRDALVLEGVQRANEVELIKLFETTLIHAGKIPEKYLRLLHDIIKAKKDYDAKKLTKSEITSVKKHTGEFIRFIVEYVQRRRGREIERAKIRVKYGKKYGEVTMLDKVAFIILDVDSPDKEVMISAINKDGSLGAPEKSSFEELEKYLSKIAIPPRVFIKGPVFESLKRIFNPDVEVLMSY